MAIELTSETWENAGTFDHIRTKIYSLLSDNQEQAFSVGEIEEHIVENDRQLFPESLVGDDALDGAKAARQAIVATILENRYWHSEVRFRCVSEDNEQTGLYYTWDGIGISPVAEVDEVKDPDPDSPFGKLSGRFRQIENDASEERSELEERISHLEYRVQEELGLY